MVASVIVLHPRMQQQVLGGDALGRIATQQRANHAARLRREALGNLELAARDLQEEGDVLGVVERVTVWN